MLASRYLSGGRMIKEILDSMRLRASDFPSLCSEHRRQSVLCLHLLAEHATMLHCADD